MGLYDTPMGNASITGMWFNKRTGETINVRDSFSDGESLQIMTYEGNIISGDVFARDYIQCDDTVYDENGKPTEQTETVDYEAMFSGMQSSTPEMNYAADTLLKQDAQPLQQSVQSKNNPALEKLFSKLDDYPTLDINIKWDKIPVSELNMLKNIFDLTDDDIAEYIYNNYCTDIEIKAAISQAIKRMI